MDVRRLLPFIGIKMGWNDPMRNTVGMAKTYHRKSPGRGFLSTMPAPAFPLRSPFPSTSLRQVVAAILLAVVADAELVVRVGDVGFLTDDAGVKGLGGGGFRGVEALFPLA